MVVVENVTLCLVERCKKALFESQKTSLEFALHPFQIHSLLLDIGPLVMQYSGERLGLETFTRDSKVDHLDSGKYVRR